ncbi:MMPL family transporter [Sinobacterium norvegicum]|nr:MMPL family transporter [Sinobacterium norvegicum]
MRLWLGFVACMLLLLVAMSNRGLVVDADVFALLPQQQGSQNLRTAIEHYNENVSPEVVFMVSGDSFEAAEQTAIQYRRALLESGLFKEMQLEWPLEQQQKIYKFWYPYRSLLLTTEQRHLISQGLSSQLTQQAISQVYSGFSGVSSSELLSDPFLLFRDYILTMNHSGGAVEWRDSYIISQYDGKFWLLMRGKMAVAPNLFNSAEAIAQVEAITAASQQAQPNSEFKHTGVFFYAAEGMAGGQYDVSRIGVGSVIGIIVLMLIAFRSLMPIFFSLLSIACGIVTALVFTLLLFGKIHIFALVFGSAIIGVSIDYAFHFFAHRQCGGTDWQAKKSMASIYPAISLALLTSSLAYLSLLFTPLPGIQQMAVFAIVGLISAWLTVVLCYPYWIVKPALSGVFGKKVLWAWLRWCQSVARYRRFLWLAPVAALLVVTVWPGWQIDDDIHSLQTLSPELVEQQQMITRVTASDISTTFLIVGGDNLEQMLQRTEATADSLQKLVSDGWLKGFRAIPVPSQQRQLEDNQLQQRLMLEQLAHLKTDLGADQLASPKSNAPLLFQSWIDSEAADGWRDLWLSADELADGEPVFSIIQLHGVDNKNWLKQVASDHDGVEYIDRASSLSSLLGNIRTLVTSLLFVAYGFVMVILAVRYGFARLPQLMLAPVAATTISLATMVLLGIEINVFAMLAMVLVLGIGIDYTLFFAEADQWQLSTLVATTLAAMTTLLSFGLLALSQTAAISDFGLAVAIGIVVAWLFSPMAASDNSYAGVMND